VPFSDLFAHTDNIVRGVVACVLWYALFSAAGQGGSTLVARLRNVVRNPGPFGPGESVGPAPAILIGAIFSVFCWYGIGLGLGLGTLVWVFWALAVLLAAIGWREIDEWARSGKRRRAALQWTAAFALFYAVEYAFFTPGAPPRFLPLASYYNNDLMNYLNYTRALEDLGRSNVAGMSWVNSRAYFQTPAVFSLLASFSTFFRFEPMKAAMPALFGLSAALALMAARVSRAIFGVSWLTSVAIGATLISGPFFRYIAGNSFLSSLVALPIFVRVLWVTTSSAARNASESRGPLWAALVPCYALLLLTYPVLLIIALVVQVGIFAVGHLSDPVQIRRGIRHVSGLVIALAATVVIVPQPALYAVRNVLFLSQSGVAGWPLEFISPLALIGVPGAVDHLEIRELQHPSIIAGALTVGLVLLMASYFLLARRTTSAEQRLWVLVGAGSVLIYCAAYFLLGRSYQQWKLASWPGSSAEICACI
jgi:hypothetical protein